jgi:DNA (cytosine-5)-methyltransferase 1
MGPFHWKNRFLRINEIKRLQSFDDDHIFVGTFKDKWRLVGNAVPPKLAQVFAIKILNDYF